MKNLIVVMSFFFSLSAVAGIGFGNSETNKRIQDFNGTISIPEQMRPDVNPGWIKKDQLGRLINKNPNLIARPARTSEVQKFLEEMNLENPDVKQLEEVKYLGKKQSEVVFELKKPGLQEAEKFQKRPEEFTPEQAPYVDALKQSFKTKDWVKVRPQSLR